MLNTLSSPKRALVDQIKRSGALSVEVLADRVGLAVTTVRQHLGDLMGSGVLARTAQVEGRGRPRYLYELSEHGQSLYPSAGGSILEGLLLHLLKGGHQEILDAFFRKAWSERRAEFDRRLRNAADDSLQTRLEVLQGLLDDDGFMPEVKAERGGAIRVCELNCPMRDIVEHTALPCMLESEFVEHALGRRVRRTEHMLEGANSCSYVVEQG